MTIIDCSLPVHSLVNELEAYHFEHICDAISSCGYIIIDRIFDDELIKELLSAIKTLHKSEFHKASIGQKRQNQLNPFIRQDHIYWVDKCEVGFQKYAEWMDTLRLHINRTLYLGLFEYECHVARYDKGAFYKKHVDAFHGQMTRRLTSILYLNQGWQKADGGELVLYDRDGETVLETVLPKLGRMVLFLSEAFPHEVLPANRSRYSLTGWFRVKSETGL